MLCALWILVGPLSARATELTREQQVEILNEAVRASDRGAQVRQSSSTEGTAAFREAAAKFQLLVDTGLHNGKLYYNLANAYLEAGQIGKAILNYRRAERLIPGDARVEHNLGYARSLRRNQFEATGQRAFLRTLFFWHYSTSLRNRYLFGMLVYVAFWMMALVRVFLPRFRWRYLMIPSLALWVILGISVAIQTVQQSHTLDGVIVADDVVVRKGNGERFEPQFKQKLHEGVEFLIIEQHLDWLHVELPDGKSGWIPTNQAELI